MAQDYKALAEGGEIGVASLYEAAGKIGALPSDIKPLTPTFRLFGPAFPVQSPPADNLWLHRAISQQGSGAAKDVMLPTKFSPELHKQGGAMLDDLEAIMLRTHPEAIRATLPGLAERMDSVPNLPGIKVPVLVIHG